MTSRKPARGVYRPLSPADKRRAWDMRQAGSFKWQIAAALGCTQCQVDHAWRWVRKELGLGRVRAERRGDGQRKGR